MKKYAFDAVVFDLDGVITQTAGVHAAAWKAVFDEYLRMRQERSGEPFREFTHQHDYLPFVDGIPRAEGVKRFLQSRQIDIPFGDPQDSPDQETVCGLGNKKNVIFRQLLEKQGAEVYPSTIKLIKSLKRSGIRVGVASSSKNCRIILQSVGIEKFFETRVDGLVSVKLGLKGKPESDIFVTAARNLGVSPAKAVVVEDASLGVAAGRNGGFGLVLGVARENNQSELTANGADIVVGDLSEIDINRINQWFHRKPRPLFESLKETGLLKAKRLVFFLDYDGTLTPIVERPKLAVLSEEMRKVVQRLAKQYIVAIVSGRMKQDVQKLVKIEGIFYAGSHGFEISGANLIMVQPKAKQAIPLIAEIRANLTKRLKGIPGLLIEQKKYSVAVHYRLVQAKHLPKIKPEMDRLMQGQQTLRMLSGKKVFEILPNIDWDKAKAVRWIMQALKLSWSENHVVYIGDDTTDEDVFRAVRTRGTTILVADKSRESAADFQLFSTEEVKTLFEQIIARSPNKE